MKNNYLQSLSVLFFWLSPLLFWLFWQFILFNPVHLYWFLLAIILCLSPVSYEVVGKRLNWNFVAIFYSLAFFVISFFLFSSLLKSGWPLQLLWLYFIWHLYRYLLSARNFYLEKKSEFSYFIIYHLLISVFLFSSLVFGVQSFLSLAVWPLLAISLPVFFFSLLSLAWIETWLKNYKWWFWFLFALLTTEIILALSWLPLSFIILGILSTLFYYSTLNFTRLYIDNRLTAKKIKNYAIFTIVSLIIIFLTARWL